MLKVHKIEVQKDKQYQQQQHCIVYPFRVHVGEKKNRVKLFTKMLTYGNIHK